MHQLFNRTLHRQRREKAARGFHCVDFLIRDVTERVAERLPDIDRRFPVVAELGCHTGIAAEILQATGQIDHLIQTDYAAAMVAQAPSALRIVSDEELLPFADHSLDAIISLLSLHWVNDLPGCLIQCQKALKPDGLLLAVVPGPRTLQELRESILAVSAHTGKLAPRISPFVEVRDAGALLQRANFALPVVDSETVTIHYRDPFTLLSELRAMGEANALREQHTGLTSPHFWPQVMQHYAHHYALPDGRLPVTVELIFMTAWSPHHSQQQPARRGSGKVSLRTALTDGSS